MMRGTSLLAAMLLALFPLAAWGEDDSVPAPAPAPEGNGRVTIVYEDDAIKPENREVIASIKKSGVFERMAERLTATVALPHDLEVVVTDRLPVGVDDPNTELDGRRIFWPAAFSKDTHDALAEALPAVRAKGAPKVIAPENLTAEILNIWSNQYILGHEMGHALIHQFNLPLTGLEEDSADGFGTFFTVNDEETGPNAALAAALLFDAMGSKKPNLTLEDFSSDHEVILQRVYNFLCAAFGHDPQRLQSLVADGYLPELRAMMCGKEWTQLNYGWWTMLAPHLTDSAKKETETVRQQARQELVEENAALFAKFRKMRGQE